MMEVFSHRTSVKRTFALEDALQNDKKRIDEWNSKHKKRRCHLSAGVNGEHAKHQSKEHRPAVAGKNSGWRDFEKKGSQRQSCQDEGKQSKVWLFYAITKGQKS